MLYIVAFINKDLIDKVYIRNKGIIDKKGRYKYVAFSEKYPDKKFVIYHKRDEGYEILSSKVLKKLYEIRKEREGNDGRENKRISKMV